MTKIYYRMKQVVDASGYDSFGEPDFEHLDDIDFYYFIMPDMTIMANVSRSGYSHEWVTPYIGPLEDATMIDFQDVDQEHCYKFIRKAFNE